MNDAVKNHIQELVDLETKGWNTKNPDLFLSIIHPDMAWPWAPTPDAHDPVDWVFVLGRFDRERWRKNWQDIFDTHDLVCNSRKTVKIEVSNEQDAAFAVVDIDTHWRHKVTKGFSLERSCLQNLHENEDGRMENDVSDRGTQLPSQKDCLTMGKRNAQALTTFNNPSVS